MQALHFQKGNYYQILTYDKKFALKNNQTQLSKYQNSNIIYDQPNVQSIQQLFMIQKIGQEDDDYQLISCPSTLVLEVNAKDVRLKYGNRNNNQLYAICEAITPNHQKYYWIKTEKNGSKALFMEGSLKAGPFDPNNPNQLFFFRQVSPVENLIVKQSCMIINNLSYMALDVPKGSIKKGQRIIQYQINKRWNQRWKFVKHGKGYLIQSLYNSMVLDISHQKKVNQAQVIQWERTGNSNQQWFPQQVGNGLVKFRSCHEPSLFLAIKGQSIANQAKLQVSNVENSTMYWRIDGALP